MQMVGVFQDFEREQTGGAGSLEKRIGQVKTTGMELHLTATRMLFDWLVGVRNLSFNSVTLVKRAGFSAELNSQHSSRRVAGRRSG